MTRRKQGLSVEDVHLRTAKEMGVHPDELVFGDGVSWRGVARCAHARRSAGQPLNDRDLAALKRFPDRPSW